MNELLQSFRLLDKRRQNSQRNETDHSQRPHRTNKKNQNIEHNFLISSEKTHNSFYNSAIFIERIKNSVKNSVEAPRRRYYRILHIYVAG